MRNYWAALKHGFTNLFRFSGRDDSVLFWSYAATIIFVVIIVMMVGMIPMMAESMAKMQEFAMQNPDQATIRQGPGSYSISIEGEHPEFLPNMEGIFAFIGIVSAVVVLMLAAAVCRRLHDTGLRGFWGLIPIPFLIIGTTIGPRVFQNFGSGDEPDVGTFMLLFLNNMLYLGSLGLLLFLLLRKSVAEPIIETSTNISDDKPPRPARRRP